MCTSIAISKKRVEILTSNQLRKPHFAYCFEKIWCNWTSKIEKILKIEKIFMPKIEKICCNSLEDAVPWQMEGAI